MPNPRRRHGKARRDRSRTHVKIASRQTVKCSNCGATKIPHRICAECGQYKGRTFKATVTK